MDQLRAFKMGSEYMGPTFTPERLNAFYERIHLPKEHRHAPGSPAISEILSSQSSSLDLLGAIQRHCVTYLPFENLALHYDLNHMVHLSIDYVFDKMITRNTGRGGWCMELNNLLSAALAALGFTIRVSAGKVNESLWADDHSPPRESFKFQAWNHMVLILLLPDEEGTPGAARFLVDIGFGGGCPTMPIPLVHGAEVLNIPAAEGEREHRLRVVKERVYGDEIWVLDRQVSTGEFRPFYGLSNMQFSPDDFEILNSHVATAKNSFFTYEIFVTRNVLNEDSSRVIGDVILFGKEFKRREYGKTVETRKLKSEQERIDLLKEWFGITLNAVERAALQGTAAQIRPDSEM